MGEVVVLAAAGPVPLAAPLGFAAAAGWVGWVPVLVGGVPLGAVVSVGVVVVVS